MHMLQPLRQLKHTQAKYKIKENNSVYCAPSVSICEADGYASEITVSISGGKSVKYKMAFMCRVNPELFTEHNPQVIPSSQGKQIDCYWRVMHESGIRTYGLSETY